MKVRIFALIFFLISVSVFAQTGITKPGGGVTVGGSISGGVDTRVLFNDGGLIGDDSAFTWNKTTNELTITLLVCTLCIDATDIAADAITEAKLKAVDAAVDEDILTFESTTGDFEWLTQNAGTNIEADLEEETHATEHSLGGTDPITATNLASACTDAQVLGGTAGGTGVECQAAGGAAPFVDTTSIVEGSGDATKEVRIEADGITTGTIRTWTAPNENITVAGRDVNNAFSARQDFTRTAGVLTDSEINSYVEDTGLNGNPYIGRAGHFKQTLNPSANQSGGQMPAVFIESLVPSTNVRTLTEMHGLYVFPSHDGTGAMSHMAGIVITPWTGRSVSQNSPVSTMRGTFAWLQNYGTGVITTATGHQVEIDDWAAGSITNARGINIAAFSGTITNAIGVDIASQTAGSTLNRAIRTTGTGISEFGSGFINNINTVTGADSLIPSDCGRLTTVSAGIDTFQIVLPEASTVLGCEYTISYIGADAGALLDISPLDSDADGIDGTCGAVVFSGTADADIGFTKATIQTGDMFKLSACSAAQWCITGCVGIAANN
jgi:hypothetical protein